MKISANSFVLTFILSWGCMFLWGCDQQYTLEGTVKSSAGEPLEKVEIFKGEHKHTTTDVKGFFGISCISGHKAPRVTLTFKKDGFEDKTIKVSCHGHEDVLLEESES